MAKKAKKHYDKDLDLTDSWPDHPIYVDRLVKTLNEEWRVRVCALKEKHKRSTCSVVPAFSYRNNGYGEFKIFFFGWELNEREDEGSADGDIYLTDAETTELARERIRENVRELLKTFSKIDW